MKISRLLTIVDDFLYLRNPHPLAQYEPTCRGVGVSDSEIPHSHRDSPTPIPSQEPTRSSATVSDQQMPQVRPSAGHVSSRRTVAPGLRCRWPATTAQTTPSRPSTRNEPYDTPPPRSNPASSESSPSPVTSHPSPCACWLAHRIGTPWTRIPTSPCPPPSP